MSWIRWIYRSLAGYRRMHTGLLIGTILTGAILTGALLVGASVRQTLEDHALARIGNITHALAGGSRYFTEDLAKQLAEKDSTLQPISALILPGMVMKPAGSPEDSPKRLPVTTLGIHPDFWTLFNQHTGDIPEIGVQEALIDERTAALLGVGPGDDIQMRMVRKSLMPQDAPLAATDKKGMLSFLVTVRAVIPDRRGGCFSLLANQIAAHNIFLNQRWMQEQLEWEGRINLLLTAEKETADRLNAALEKAWRPEQIGLRWRTHESGIRQLESDRIFLEDPVVAAASRLHGATPILTYLVNAIAGSEKSTPYSFVQAGAAPPGLPEDQVAIHPWLAEQLAVKEGDTLTLTYMQPTAANTLEERRSTFIVGPTASPEKLALERSLAPRFPGLSDVENCRDWDVGLPMEKEKLADPANEAYWKAYGQTPKLITTYAAGKALWENRFGAVTAIRFAAEDAAGIEAAFRQELPPSALGISFLPVRDQALTAVAQSMDFGGLFLGMSFFLIIAALLLLALLFIFGLQQRTQEMGILLASGISLPRLRRLYLVEALPTAFLGSLLGAGAGLVYAALLLAGLRYFWAGAVGGAHIRFHASLPAITEGILLSLICILLTLTVTISRMMRRTVTNLIHADATTLPPPVAANRRIPGAFLLSLIPATSALTALVSTFLRPPEKLQGPVFAIGALILLAGIGFYAAFLGRLARRPSPVPFRRTDLALANLVRRRGRSLSIAAVTACGCFMIFTVSAMQENMALHADRPSSGTGGFPLYGESIGPLLGAPETISEAMKRETLPLRVHDGEDAGCLNLNHTQTPRLLGVDPGRMEKRGAFMPENASDSVWRLLTQPLPDAVIPALVGDTDTAQWGLRKKIGPNGDIITYRDDQGREVRLKLVGALPMRLSVFQGTLLIHENDFTRLFPAEAGYRAFLIDTPPESMGETITRLQKRFEKEGLSVIPAVDQLRKYYAMESAYLTMFLVLGALGMILGAGGAGIVVLRNLYERRTEIALLYAVGYTVPKVRALLWIEQCMLTIIGILIGSTAAFAAIFPLAYFSQTQVSLTLQLLLLLVILFAHILILFPIIRIALPKKPLEGLRGE